jgi:hypothetical protein
MITMTIDKANEITKTVNIINSCNSFLASFKGRGYEDEFEIYYRGCHTCDLELDALQILIAHYEKKLFDAENKLKTL